MAPIYTKAGDDGSTGLIGDVRVSKDDSRIEMNGVLDELSAVLGLVRAQSLPDGIDGILHRVQCRLFSISAEVADPEGSGRKEGRISGADINALEAEIDAMESVLPPLRKFVLPGGAAAAAQLHLARAVSRRAERQCVALARSHPVNGDILHYLNRLSDLLFVLARRVNHLQSVAEFHPTI